MREGVQHTLTLLLSDAARPLRFIVTGGVAGILQLGLLAALTGRSTELFAIAKAPKSRSAVAQTA